MLARLASIDCNLLPHQGRAEAHNCLLLRRCSGEISTFIVEPFVPHDQEFYLSIQSQRLGNVISFSEAGGVEIEENWEQVKTVTISTMQELTEGKLAPILGSLRHDLRKKMEKFLQAVYGVISLFSSRHHISRAQHLLEIPLPSYQLHLQESNQNCCSAQGITCLGHSICQGQLCLPFMPPPPCHLQNEGSSREGALAVSVFCAFRFH